MFSLRIVSTSHYQAEPIPGLDVLYSSFRSADVRKIPLLRIFGVTPAGQKTCMHVHGVFPYLLVPYDGTAPADSYMRRFAVSLDKSINVANNSSSSMQHVFKISLVSGIPLYGYHGEEQQFLKIYLYNPDLIRKSADLLLGGAVMNKSFQPHEAHIPYPLQLFIDYNLYGMNLINVGAIKFRRCNRKDSDTENAKQSTDGDGNMVCLNTSQRDNRNGDSTGSFHQTPNSSYVNSPTLTRWDLNNLSSEMLLPADVERQSLCELEVDVVAADILNQREIIDKLGSNPGLSALWEDERQRRRDARLSSQITPPESQEHQNVQSSDRENKLMERLVEIIQQHRALSRSESEESVISAETTLTPTDVVCIPASQLENHSQSVQGSQGLTQDTIIILPAEEEEKFEEDAPVINLESIHHVVSFSESFLRPSSHPSTISTDDKAVDHSLVDVLAALAEESSPSSQRCAATLSAMEDQDSVVGHRVSVMLDFAALQGDEEETLHMSQALLQDPEDNDNFDLLGLDVTWNGSPVTEKAHEAAAESDDTEDDHELDIPQLDGTSDEKSASSKSSKKRLGVRGSLISRGSNSAQNLGSSMQGELSNLPSISPVQSPVMQGSSDQRVMSPQQQQVSMETQTQHQVGFYGPQQWGDSRGGVTNVSGMSHYPVPNPSMASWRQSSLPHGSYSTMFRSPGNNYGYYHYPQCFPCNPSFRQGGAPSNSRQADFSPPPHSPMSPTTYSNSNVFPCSQSGSSPQQFSSFVHPTHSQGTGMASMRRHSEGSISHQGNNFSSPHGWQFPAPLFANSESSKPLSAGSAAAVSPEVWSSTYSGEPTSMQNNNQNLIISGKYDHYPNAVEPSEKDRNQPQSSTEHVLTCRSKMSTEASNLSEESQKPTSTLQALLEAPDSSRVTHSHIDTRYHIKTAATLDAHASPLGCSDIGEKDGQKFKYPEKRSASFSSLCSTIVGGGQSSALSGLYSFVANVDPMARTPTPTSHNSTPTPSTPSSTPTSGPSPCIGNKEEGSREEEGPSFIDLTSNQTKRQSQQSSLLTFRSKSTDETTCLVVGHLPASLSPLPFAYRDFNKDVFLVDQVENQSKRETTASSQTTTLGTGTVSFARTERLGKQSRMRRLGLNLLKARQLSEDIATSQSTTPTPSASYTFTFHVPTPVYKRFKMRGVFPIREEEDIKVVRMHPMDARRYSLLKIGRELVRISRLSRRELGSMHLAGPDDRINSRDEHNSQIDPHTGELLPSVPRTHLLQGFKKVKLGASRRLLGPKCRRVKTTANKSCHASGTVTDIGVQIKVECDQEAREESCVGLSECKQEMEIDSSLDIGQPHQNFHFSASSGDNTDNLSESNQPMNIVGNSTQPWQTLDRDRRPSVKVEYPAQRPVHSSQWPNSQPPAETWAQETNPDHSAGQWGGHWQGCNYQQEWDPDPSQSYNYPSAVESSGSKQNQTPNHYPYNTWSRSSSAPSAAFSSSGSQPVPSGLSSPSANQSSIESSSYSHAYSHNYPGYNSSQYNQAAFSPSGQQDSPGNKLGGYPNMGPVSFPYPGASPQHTYTSGHNSGHVFQPSHPIPLYPCLESGKDGYPSNIQGSFISPQPQGNMHGQYQQQGQYMPPISTSSNYQQGRGFSPQGQFSTSPDSFSGNTHCTQFSPAVQSDQFPISSNHQCQFTSPSGQFCGQSGQYSSSSEQPAQFLSPSTQAGQFPSLVGQTSQISSSSNLGQFSPCDSQQNPMSPQVNYQTHRSPNTAQQNQFFPLVTHGSQNICNPEFTDTRQFPLDNQNNPSIGITQISSSENNENNHFLDTSNQGNPFLHQGACQASVNSTSDPINPLGHDNSKQPGRPRTVSDYNQEITELHSKVKDKLTFEKSSKGKLTDCLHKSDDKIAENESCFKAMMTSEEEDFINNGLKKNEIKSFGSSISGKQIHLSNRRSPVTHIARRSSVQLWSDGDSDSEEDNTDQNEESSDDYLPASNMHWNRRKRKRISLHSQTEVKRTKRSSVNYNTSAFSRYLASDVEKKNSRRRRSRRPSKNHKNKKHPQQHLIEGIHYIVVGKFKGHKVMLVKMDRVKVNLNERVKVSEWQGKGERDEAKTRPRLLGPRCCRLVEGSAASDPCFVQGVEKTDGTQNFEDDSDASTIVEGDFESNCSVKEIKFDLEAVPTEDTLVVRETAQQKDDSTEDYFDDIVRKLTDEDKFTHIANNEDSQKTLNQNILLEASAGNAEASTDMECSLKDDRTCDAQQAERLEITENKKKFISEESLETICSESSSQQNCSRKISSECELCSGPLSLLPNPASGDEETRQGGTTDLPITMEEDADNKMESSEPSSGTQSPDSRPGKRHSDSSSIVSEHSQDADSSLQPHSNPDSASPSSVSLSISLTATSNHDNNFQLHYHLKSDSKLIEREDDERESKGSSDSFCFQTVREKVKEVHTNQQALEPSSDSSDSHACFSELRVQGDDVQQSQQSVSFPWEENVTSEMNTKTAEMDKDKLRKQKQLTTNQRLGVAFLSKKSRRRRNKTSASSSKGESGCNANKLMDSLSLLHEATLASFGGYRSNSIHNDGPSSSCDHVKNQAEEKENCNMGALEHVREKNVDRKMFSFRGESEWKSRMHSSQENECEMFRSHSSSKSTGFGEVEINSTVYREERKVISGSTEFLPASEFSHEPVIFTNVSLDKQLCTIRKGGKIYKNLTEKLEESAAKITRRHQNRHLRGNRRKKLSKKAGCRKSVSNRTNKLLDSLDMLHIATLASLGNDPLRKGHDNSYCSGSLSSRYCDLVSDHVERYDESLIKMSFMSPVHSDLDDLSPPIPLSPGEFSKQTEIIEQKQRPMPCRAKLDENRGTCTVRMAQLRAKNSGKMSYHLMASAAFHKKQKVHKVSTELSPCMQYSIKKSCSPSSVSLPDKLTVSLHKTLRAKSSSLHTNDNSSTLPSPSSPVHSSMPDPNDLPTPAIPWHHPLHVYTDDFDGGAWKDRVISDALTEKYRSRNNSLSDEISPSLGSQHRDINGLSSRTPPFTSVLQKSLHAVIPKTSPILSSPQNNRNSINDRLKDTDSLVPLKTEHSHFGDKVTVFSSKSHKDICVNVGKNCGTLLETNKHGTTNNSKASFSLSISKQNVQSASEKTGSVSLSNREINGDKTTYYSSISLGDGSGDKSLQLLGQQHSRWLCDRSNTSTVNQTLKSLISNDRSSQSNRSPRDFGLSRTDIIISQMFNLNSSHFTQNSSPKGVSHNKTTVSPSKNKSADSLVVGSKQEWKHSSQDRNVWEESKQMSDSAKSSASFSVEKHQLQTPLTFPQNLLPANHKQVTPFTSVTNGSEIKSSLVYSQASEKALSVNSENSLNASKLYPSLAARCHYESSGSPLNFAAKDKNEKSLPAGSVRYHSDNAKSSSSSVLTINCDQSISSSVHRKSHCATKSPGMSSLGNFQKHGFSGDKNAKSPPLYSVRCQSNNAKSSPSLLTVNCDQAMSPSVYSKPHSAVKSSSLENFQKHGFSGDSYSIEHSNSPSVHSTNNGRFTYNSSVSESVGSSLNYCYSRLTAKTASIEKTAVALEKPLRISKSPVVASPHSKFNGSSKSPPWVSPSKPICKRYETGSHKQSNAWSQQNRKQSIGEYLEEMIESTFAELMPEASKVYNSSVLNSAVKVQSDGQTFKNSYCEVKTSPVKDLQNDSSRNVTRDTSVALDLSAGSRKYEATACSVSSLKNQPMLTDLASTTAAETSTRPTVSRTTASLGCPTWTSIKTDNFENITDDEDDVIPSSQEYSTSVFRFPGFRRLSSISSSWSPYSLQSHSVVPAVTKSTTGISTVDKSERNIISEVKSSTNDCIIGLNQRDRGMYSECLSMVSKLGGQAAFSSGGNSPEKYNNANEPVPQSLATSFGTPWQDTPTNDSAHTITSQFEPITDSEDEEDRKTNENSQTVTSKYSTAYSLTYSTSSFSAYKPNKMSVPCTSMNGSSTVMGSCTSYPLRMEASGPWSSSPFYRQSYGNSLSSSNSNDYHNALVKCDSNHTIGPNFTTSPLTDSSGILQKKSSTGIFNTCTLNGGDNDPKEAGGNEKEKSAEASNSSKSALSSSSSLEKCIQQQRRKDSDDSRSNENGSKTVAETGIGGGKHVFCPRDLPPSWTAVENNALSFGLTVEPVTRAFCSNPPDLPDRPRELGGRVLRLATKRVAELEEMAPPGDMRGLRAWQTLQATENSVVFSQSESDAVSFVQRLQKEPLLHFAFSGDRPCIITPVKPPPQCSSVIAWLRDKLWSIRPCRLASGPKRAGESGVYNPNMENSLPLDIDAPLDDSEGVELKYCSDEEDAIFTHLRDHLGEAGDQMPKKPQQSSADEIGECIPKRQRLDSDGTLHSTPIHHFSSELFNVKCTAVLSGEKLETSTERKMQAGAEFAKPKQPPIRRLSTNTESALRLAVFTAKARRPSLEGERSQIEGPTPQNTHGFKVTQQNLQNAKALHQHQFLTVLSMELHVDSRGDLMPDPEVDAIRVVFYAVFDDIPPDRGRRNITGAFVVDNESCSVDESKITQMATSRKRTGKKTLLEKCGILDDLDIVCVESEEDLLKEFTYFVRRLDPDILLGFEIQQLSWGFLLQRSAHLSFNLCSQIARIQDSKKGNRFSAEKDEWGAAHSSEIHIEGRIVLNLWRILRHEVTLNIYNYENCAFHILHQRIPAYTFRTLTLWFNHCTHLHRWRVVQHYTQRVRGQLAMLDQLDIIGKTSEFARVFGIEFYDVLSRGSQYRVESMMLRLAKPLNFIPVSPSVQQRTRQKAAECIPLTLEPQSRFYTDPMVILDFQSLYPSIMIAYNYCFSTCLGRLENLAHTQEGPIEFGCTSLNISPETLRNLQKKVTISPNGCVFVTSEVRRGVLPMMVEEILKTRLMVKKSMKECKDDKMLHKMLDARQLSLKLIANVTYGYTGASFSGRMPCIEVGDSIVRKARESLERAIQLVKDTARWQAQVVYGDTDSLFIALPGRSKDEAFMIGQEIADAVTNMFPKPMKLRFEKVYLPCVLQTKKRYVGFMYETIDQKEPTFDAKGIETVRRDNCGVVSKMLERCIKILFTVRDVSQVRMYMQRQFTKMLSGHVGLQDYIFAKEYRGIMGYKSGACVPALEIARKRLREDCRAEPRVGERVPYVIVHGSPGLPLIQLVRQPQEFLSDASLRINVTYYITKQVLPPLDRVLGLVGVSVFQWYSDMPKVVRLAPHVAPALDMKQGTISQYFMTSDCLVCEQQTKQEVCASCLKDPQLVAVTLAASVATWEAVQDRLVQVCITCMGVQDHTQPCVSFSCPVLFRRHLATCDIARANQQRCTLTKVLDF